MERQYLHYVIIFMLVVVAAERISKSKWNTILTNKLFSYQLNKIRKNTMQVDNF